MKSCPSCQAEFDDAAEFCPYDGSKLAAGGGEDVSLIGQTIAEHLAVPALAHGTSLLNRMT